MKKIWILSLIFIFMASLPSNAAMKKLGQAGMTFLTIGGSARATGMSDAFGFAKGDLASVFYNPAGLASVNGRAFLFNYTSWVADMNVTNFAASYNANSWGVFALNAQVMDYGDFVGTVVDDTDPKGYQDADVGDVGGLSIGLSYGYQMTDKFAIGGTAKYVNQKLGNNDTYSAGALDEAGHLNKTDCFAFDFGTLYDTGIRSLAVHMSIRNYSGQQLYENEEFQLPQTYRIGFSANMFELLPFLPSAGNSLLLDIEGVAARDRDEYLNLGLEYSLIDMLDLRGGFAFERAQDGTGGLSLGTGLKLDSLGFGGRLDVSYNDFGSVLGSVMRVSIQGSF